MEAHADFLLALIAEQSDMTLDEVVAAMRKRRIKGSRSAVWRFFDRHGISFKKTIWDSVAPVGVETLGALSCTWKGAAECFLVASDPVKKHGPWAVAGLKVATPSGDPVLGN